MWFEEQTNYLQVIKKLGISEEVYISLIRSVQDVFSRQWVDSECSKIDPHIVHPELLPYSFKLLPCNPIPLLLSSKKTIGGFLPVINLIRLGQLIQVAQRNNMSKSSLERLRGKRDDYIGAFFELEVLMMFIDSGFSLASRYEADGMDYTFERTGAEVNVEVTHRGASKILDIIDRIAKKEFDIWAGTDPKPASDGYICVNLKYDLDYYTDAAISEIAQKIVQVQQDVYPAGFEDQRYCLRISLEKRLSS